MANDGETAISAAAPSERPVIRDTFTVSWDRFHSDTRALARRLLAMDPFKGVVAVSRGGLVPGAIIARELELRLVDTICVASYDHQTQGSLTMLKDVAGDGEGMLIVDDLVDSGKTAKAVRASLPRAHFATVYAKPDGRPTVDTFITEVAQDCWILFPWDIAPQFIEPMAKVRTER